MFENKNKMTVALLSGGISSEREVSIKSGNQVFESLDKVKYHVIRYDPKNDLPRLVADAPQIDVAMIILHGPYGEDGTMQGFLDLLNIPYQGSGVLGSAIAMNKIASKRLYEKSGLPIPAYVAIDQNTKPDHGKWIERIGLPCVIKPATGGSSIGTSIVRKESDLSDALQNAFNFDHTVLIEEYIEGIEITGGVLGNDDLQSLPLIEIIPDKAHPFFDYKAKYTPGATNEICPARIDAVHTEKAQMYAKIAHSALFCRGYSRTDMILRQDTIYVLETNTIPGMTPTSLFPQAAAAAGIPFGKLLDRLIDLALEEKAKK